MRQPPLSFLLFFLPTSLASYCGQAAIPFTFQSLRSGQPVLGCARPRCFGWNANGTRADDTAQFYRINGKEDGYLRRSDIVLRAPANSAVSPQTSRCEQEYRTGSCNEGEWVGGIAPLSNAKVPQMQVRCCSYPLLFESEDRGVAPIKAGQVFIGGEVVEGSRLVAFDYISDISKRLLPNNTVLYEISVRRMPCSEEDEAQNLVSSNADLQNLDGDVVFRQDQPRSQKVAQRFIRPQVASLPSQQVPQRIQQLPQAPSNYGANGNEAQRIAQYGVQNAQGTAGVRQQQQQLVQEVLPQAPMSLNGAGYPPLQNLQPLFSNSVPPPPARQSPTQVFPNSGAAPLAPAQPQFQGVQGQMQMPALPTLPPLNLPKLEDLPQLQIPTVEQVEEVIPPMQKAILANIAKFFGVL